MRKVLVITPIFLSDAGGAAIYYKLLVSLLSKSYNTETGVVSERYTYHGDLRYYGIFPTWAGRDRNIVRDIFFYFLQNVSYFGMFWILFKERPNIVLVHSSFYNHPGIFDPVFRLLKMFFPRIRFVADVRDRLLPQKKLSLLNYFDRIISCSENVYAHLLSGRVDPKKVLIIPVIQEEMNIPVIRGQFDSLCKTYGLCGRQYFIYVGAVKEDKAVDILLEAYVDIVRPKFPEIDFVLVGLNKSKGKDVASMLEMDGVIYLGNLPREHSLALMSGANLCVNISPNEGMPRVSLESIALNKPTLLPPNIPEFHELCPEYVVSDLSVPSVGRQICKLLETPSVPVYPIAKHYPEAVLSQYEEVFEDVGSAL